MTINHEQMGQPRIGEVGALAVECYSCGDRILAEGGRRLLVPVTLIGPDTSLTDEQALLFAQGHESNLGVEHDIRIRRWFGRKSDFAVTSSRA